MSLLVSIRNTNPMGDVTVHDPVTGDRTHVKASAIVEVTPELAGTEPRWRRVVLDADGNPAEPISSAHTREHAGHLELLDLGSGLLAQVGNWEPAKDDNGDGTDGSAT